MNCGYPFNDRFSFWPGNVYTAYCLPCLHIQDMEYVCEHSFSPIYLVTGVNSPAFSSYLHQEEGHAVRLQGPGELHILHFCLDLRHLATVFMFLDRDHQSHLHPSITTYCMLCVDVMRSTCFQFCQFISQQRTNYYNSHGPPTVSNTLFPLNATFEQCNVHTWNIFFSDPLCLVYSFGRNSFRLQR